MNLELSIHADERLLERTNISPIALQSIYKNKQYVRLGHDLKKKNVVHWLTYNSIDNSFYIFVVDEKKLSVITVLYGDELHTWMIDPSVKECCKIGDFKLATLNSPKKTKSTKLSIHDTDYSLQDFGFLLIKKRTAFMFGGKEYDLGGMVSKKDFLNYLDSKFNVSDYDLYYKVIDELKIVLDDARAKNKKRKIDYSSGNIHIKSGKKYCINDFNPIFNQFDLTYNIFGKNIFIFEHGLNNLMSHDDFRSMVRTNHAYISNKNIKLMYKEFFNEIQNIRKNYLMPYFNHYFSPFLLTLSKPFDKITKDDWDNHCLNSNFSFKVSLFDGFLMILKDMIENLTNPSNLKDILLDHTVDCAIQQGYNDYTVSEDAIIKLLGVGRDHNAIEKHTIKHNCCNIKFDKIRSGFLEDHKEVFVSDVISLLEENNVFDFPLEKNNLISLLKTHKLIPSVSIDDLMCSIESEYKLKKSDNNFMIVLNFNSDDRPIYLFFHDADLILEDSSKSQLVSDHTNSLIHTANESNLLSFIHNVKIYKKSFIMGREFVSSKILYQKN